MEIPQDFIEYLAEMFLRWKEQQDDNKDTIHNT